MYRGPHDLGPTPVEPVGKSTPDGQTGWVKIGTEAVEGDSLGLTQEFDGS